MEESNKLVSFKEFIARCSAVDFFDPLEEDWDFAEEVLEGKENFLYGKEGVDLEIYQGMTYYYEYELYMLAPDTWWEANQIDRFTGTIVNINQLLNQTSQ